METTPLGEIIIKKKTKKKPETGHTIRLYICLYHTDIFLRAMRHLVCELILLGETSVVTVSNYQGICKELLYPMGIRNLITNKFVNVTPTLYCYIPKAKKKYVR